jgi:hypothetical protein
LVAISSVPAEAATCKVENARTDRVYLGHGANLQRAIDAARKRDHLRITGICVGTFTLEERLFLIGVANRRFPRPTLDANGRGSVLTLEHGATLRSLRIRDGSADLGGGIYQSHGRLQLLGHTMIVQNRAGAGGGIYVANGRAIVADSSTIRGNVARNGGGAYFGGYSVGVIREDASVRDNHARQEGGGIAAGVTTVRISGHATIRGNSAGQDGGGMVSYDGYFEFHAHASVVGNSAGGNGGGVYLVFASMFVCSDHVSLSPNIPNDPPSFVVPDPLCREH